jgi:DNA repair exonuclease SbcCD ATPase subunit/DNA repair exonuclease SbcCD nuclease subunit
VPIVAKIAFYADLHLRASDLKERSEALEWMLQKCQELKVDLVVNCGDTFDHGKVGSDNASVGAVLEAFMKPHKKVGYPSTIILEGNHDYWDPSAVSPVSILSHMPNAVVVVDTPTLIPFKDFKLLCIPWQDHLRAGKKYKNFKAYRDFVKKEAARWGPKPLVIAGHMDMAAFEGMKWNYWTPEDIASMGAVFHAFGHYHTAQKVKGIENCIYTGSLVQKNYGESGNWTGFHTFDTASLEWRAVPYEKGPFYLRLKKENYPVHNLRSTYITSDLPLIRQIHNTPQGLPEYRNICTDLSLASIRFTGYTPEEQEELKKRFPNVRALTFREEKIESETLDIADEVAEDKLSFTELLEAFFQAKSLESDWAEVKPLVEAEIKDFERINSDLQMVGSLQEITKIRLENVGPHKDIVVELGPGNTCFRGANGSGKTFLLESLFAAAYGKWASSGRDFRQTAKNGRLEVDFVAGEEYWRISRAVTSTGPLCVVSKYDNTKKSFIEVYGGKSNTKQATEAIRSLIGSESALRGCCYIEQTPFDMIDSPDTQRMVWIQQWLGLTAYEKLNFQIKESLKSYKNYAGKDEEANNQVVRLEEGLESAEELQNKAKEDLKKIQTLQEDLEKRWAEAKEWVERESKLWDSQHALAGYKLKRVQLEEEYPLKVKELRKAERDLEGTKGDIDRLLESGHRDLYFQTLRKLETLGDSFKCLGQVGCRDNLLPCPLIDRAVAAQKASGELSVQLVECGWGDDKETLYGALKSSTEALQKEILSLKYQVNSMQTQLEQLQPPSSSPSTTIEEYRERAEEYYVMDSSRATNMFNLGKAKAAVDMYGTQVVSLNEKLKTAKQLQSMLKEVGKKIKALRLLEDATSKEGIAATLVKQSLPRISKIITHLLSYVDVDFNLSFKTEKETKDSAEESFSILFHSLKNDRVYDVRSCSPGEKALVRLVWRLAILLSSKRNSYSVLLLDEPTAPSDVEYCQATLSLLRYVSENFRQVIVVTHDEVVSNFCDKVIKL